MSRFRILLLLSAWLVGRPAAAAIVDSSQGIFFPKELAERVETFGAFPIHWWNLLTYEGRMDTDGAYVRSVCESLRRDPDAGLQVVECGGGLGAYVGAVEAWVADQRLREPVPADRDAKKAFELTLAKASLPMGRELLEVLRRDPFGASMELRRLAESRSPLRLPRQEGIYVDEKAQRLAIPVKFSFPPTETERTRRVFESLERHCGERERCERWNWIGPHASTWENTAQVFSDVTAVSVWGTALLAVVCSVIAWLSGWRLIVLFPVVGLAVVAAFAITVGLRGSIHGLTLAFGTGIIGLAFDYGLHRAVNAAPYVWRSNAVGLVTTLAVLVVILASGIPLLREVMIFSIAGVFLGFVFLYLLFLCFPGWAALRPLPLAPRRGPVGTAVTAVLLAGVLFAAARWRPAFDLAALNFQSAKSRQLSAWLFREAGASIPYFRTHKAGLGGEALEGSYRDLVAADELEVRFEGPARWLPSSEVQRESLASWRRGCDRGEGPAVRWGSALRDTPRKFFSPYLRAIDCDRLVMREPWTLPVYAADFGARDQWLSLFFPTEEQVGPLKERLPDVVSLRELVGAFPRTLGRELGWMIPLALTIVGVLLYFYFRSLSLVMLAYLPFLTGVGLCAWGFALMGTPVTFVTLLGLIMLYGLSVDYGIFATDSIRFPEEEGKGAGWTGVLYAGATTVVGFLPLLFCGHPVLVQFGGTLAFGVVGTLAGAFCGVPVLHEFFRSRRWVP